MLPLSLDTPIFKGMGLPSPPLSGCYLGCEVELEGKVPLEHHSPYWSVKAEDSLRNGYEYIFSNPLVPSKAHEAAGIFEVWMKRHSPENTIRCSTHVHVNVLDLTVRQVYQIICTFHLLEGLLFDQVPKSRHGNLFCLRMADAEKIFYDLRSNLMSGDYLAFDTQRHKYAALNLATLTGLGTLEFRFLPGMWNQMDLSLWFKIFECLYEFGKSTTPARLIEMYDELSTPNFLQKIFPTGIVTVLVGNRTYADVNKLLHVNYDYIYELARTFERQRYRTVRKNWSPDLGDVQSGSVFGQSAFDLTELATTPWPNWSDTTMSDTPEP